MARDIQERPRPEFSARPPRGRLDPIIHRLRNDPVAVVAYMLLTDTLVPLVLLVVIVLPVGAVILLFYLPKFYRNWQRRRRYRVEINTSATIIESSPPPAEDRPARSI